MYNQPNYKPFSLVSRRRIIQAATGSLAALVLSPSLALAESLRVEDHRPKLTVTHNNKDLTFVHPAYGPGTYADVKSAIEQDKLKGPTMAETASLIYASFDSSNRYSTEIKDIMGNAWLWAFTGTLYIPKKGAYIQDNPEIRNGMPFMEESGLIKKLEARDSSIRFVRFGYQVGEMNPLKLAKNPYVIGLVGEEGAEKLAKVSDKYEDKPDLWGFESVSKPLTRVSALGFRSLGSGLIVGGDNRGNVGNGRAFGIFEKTQK